MQGLVIWVVILVIVLLGGKMPVYILGLEAKLLERILLSFITNQAVPCPCRDSSLFYPLHPTASARV